MKAICTIPTGGAYVRATSRAIGRATRDYVRVFEVEVLGAVPFEPSMKRVRFPDGTVRRMFTEYLSETR